MKTTDNQAPQREATASEIKARKSLRDWCVEYVNRPKPDPRPWNEQYFKK